MSLFTIGDLHLSLGGPNKPMDVFSGWANHMELLEQNWRELISPEDTAREIFRVVAGGEMA